MVLAGNTLSEVVITVINCSVQIRKLVINTQPDRHYADMQLTEKCLWYTDRFSISWAQLMRDIHNIVVAGSVPTHSKQMSIRYNNSSLNM